MKKDKGVKVVVDYTRGYYNIIGIYNDRVYQIHKPIRGHDKDGFFKASYSRRLVKLRRKQMERDIKKIIKKDPNFKYSEKMIKKVDPLMYKVLQDWDMKSETTYALDYLKTMIQKFDKEQSFYVAREFYDESCASARKDDLARAGIDISYNVGLFNTSKSLNIFDKIKGMIIARNQAKLIKANVKSSLILKKNYYLDDIDRFVSENRPDVDNNTIGEESRTEEIHQIQRSVDVQEIMEEIDKEEQRLAREKAEKEARDIARQEKNKKRTIHKPQAKKDPAKKSKKYENADKKKRVRNHTGVRLGLTKKQRERADRIARKEYNSHYNTQMRSKDEKEARKKQAEEGMRKANEARKLEEERAAEARRLEEERVAEARRLAEEQKLAEEREAERIRLAEEKAKLARQERISKITNNRLTRRAKAEVRHWHRKLRDAKDSVKNKVFKPLAGKKLKIKAPKLKLSKIDSKAVRRIKAEVRHFKRKLRSAKDSIKNMKFKPHLSQKGKKILITGALSVLALGLLFGSSKMSNVNRSNIPAETETTTITEEYTEPERNSELEITEPSDIEQDGAEQEETESGNIEQEKIEEQETTPTEKEQDGINSSEVEQEETVESGEHQSGTVEQGEVNQEETEPSDVEQEETITPSVEQDDTEKIEEEKLEEFREMAIQKYQEALIIGETPQIGDILMDQTYSEKPDGTGNVGYFASHQDYAISHINIVTKDGYEVVEANGKNLSELLAEYPDYITYNIHFVNSKTGGWLGFVTQEQYEKAIQNKINQIIKTKTIDKNATLDEDDIMR